MKLPNHPRAVLLAACAFCISLVLFLVAITMLYQEANRY